jgi:hypothetical protein
LRREQIARGSLGFLLCLFLSSCAIANGSTSERKIRLVGRAVREGQL